MGDQEGKSIDSPTQNPLDGLIEPKKEIVDDDEEKEGGENNFLDQVIAENVTLRKRLENREAEADRIVLKSIGGGWNRRATAREKQLVRELFVGGFTLSMFTEELAELLKEAIVRAEHREPEHYQRRSTKRRRSGDSDEEGDGRRAKRRHRKGSSPVFCDRVRLEEIRQLIIRRNIPHQYVYQGAGFGSYKVQMWIDGTGELRDEDGAKVIRWYETSDPTALRFKLLHPAASKYLEKEYTTRGLATRIVSSDEILEMRRAATEIVRQTMGEHFGEWAAVTPIQVERFMGRRRILSVKQEVKEDDANA